MTKNRSNFKMGTVEMIILFLLNKKDLYGYEITSLVEKLSEGNIGITESTLYPTLYKLLGNKYISDREVQVGKRRTRVYYHLEETGKEHLEKLLTEYNKIKTPISFMRIGVFIFICNNRKFLYFSSLFLNSLLNSIYCFRCSMRGTSDLN